MHGAVGHLQDDGGRSSQHAEGIASRLTHAALQNARGDSNPRNSHTAEAMYINPPVSMTTQQLCQAGLQLLLGLAARSCTGPGL